MEAVLTAEERHQLVAVLRDLDPTAIHERRKEPRRKTLLSLVIQRIGKDIPRALTKVTLVNVSLHGLGVLSQTIVFPGDKFVISMPFQEGGGWMVLCEVKNCKRLNSGQYRVGARFLDRIEDPKGNAKVPLDWLMG